MSIVNVHNEWDPLEEVIVGRIENARIPSPDLNLHSIEYAHLSSRVEIPSGPFEDRVIEETKEDLNNFAEELEKIGVTVRRPDIFDHSCTIKTPHWENSGFYNYCPRDLFVAVNNCIVEAPVVLRARQYEFLSYRKIMLGYLEAGSRLISAPTPALTDEMFDLGGKGGERLRNFEPVFDAANTLRIGKDILYQVSDSGNEFGYRWLQSFLGVDYTVHPMRNVYAHTHIDSTITLLRPGLVLLNPERISEETVPSVFKGWDIVWCPEMVDIGYTKQPYSSKWIGMNFIMINPYLAVVDRSQFSLIKILKKYKIDVIPLSLRHARTLGGGFHCVTLDVRRRGVLESYVS
jgi:scyllo-inosamine-4-phosphate amidinotransferase 1